MDSPGKNAGMGYHFFLQRSSLPRDWTWVSHTAGRLFTIWATREAEKAEHQRIDAFRLWFWRMQQVQQTLESLLNYREIKPINPKGINPEYSLEGLMSKFQYFGHPIWRSDSLEMTLMIGKIVGKKRRGQQRMRQLYAVTDSMDMSLSKLLEMVKDREASHAAVHEVAKNQTQLSNWTTIG